MPKAKTRESKRVGKGCNLTFAGVFPLKRRERRAKVVNAEGEFQAAEKMVQAAAMIAKEPIALQLRYLQTMREMASEHNTTTFLPLPIDLFSAFLKK